MKKKYRKNRKYTAIHNSFSNNEIGLTEDINETAEEKEEKKEIVVQRTLYSTGDLCYCCLNRNACLYTYNTSIYIGVDSSHSLAFNTFLRRTSTLIQMCVLVYQLY